MKTVAKKLSKKIYFRGHTFIDLLKNTFTPIGDIKFNNGDYLKQTLCAIDLVYPTLQARAMVKHKTLTDFEWLTKKPQEYPCSVALIRSSKPSVIHIALRIENSENVPLYISATTHVFTAAIHLKNSIALQSRTVEPVQTFNTTELSQLSESLRTQILIGECGVTIGTEEELQVSEKSISAIKDPLHVLSYMRLQTLGTTLHPEVLHSHRLVCRLEQLKFEAEKAILNSNVGGSREWHSKTLNLNSLSFYTVQNEIEFTETSNMPEQETSAVEETKVDTLTHSKSSDSCLVAVSDKSISPILKSGFLSYEGDIWITPTVNYEIVTRQLAVNYLTNPHIFNKIYYKSSENIKKVLEDWYEQLCDAWNESVKSNIDWDKLSPHLRAEFIYKSIDNFNIHSVKNLTMDVEKAEELQLTDEMNYDYIELISKFLLIHWCTVLIQNDENIFSKETMSKISTIFNEFLKDPITVTSVENFTKSFTASYIQGAAIFEKKLDTEKGLQTWFELKDNPLHSAQRDLAQYYENWIGKIRNNFSSEENKEDCVSEACRFVTSLRLVIPLLKNENVSIVLDLLIELLKTSTITDQEAQTYLNNLGLEHVKINTALMEEEDVARIVEELEKITES